MFNHTQPTRKTTKQPSQAPRRACWADIPSISFLMSDDCKELSGVDYRILLTLLSWAKGGKYIGIKERPLRLSTFQLMYYTKASQSAVSKSLSKLHKLQLIDWSTSECDGIIKNRLFTINFKKIYGFVPGVDDVNLFSSRECRQRLGIFEETSLTHTQKENELRRQRYAEEAQQKRKEQLSNDFSEMTRNGDPFGFNQEPEPSPNEELKKKYADIGDF